MQEINLGALTSLIYCKKCGIPIEIYTNQEKVICENFNTNISLKVLFGMDFGKGFGIQSFENA